MLKKLTVTCGLLLAASAAMAGLPWPWMPLDSTPFPVGEGAHITYGVNPDDSGAIWGMFPDEDSSRTFVYYYSPLPGEGDTNNPNTGDWHSLPNGHSRWFGWKLMYTGMTYQWGKAPYVIGADTSEDPPQCWLDWYSIDEDTWMFYDIEEDPQEPGHEFVLGEGACIAYAPNLDYGEGNQVDGYIYCLPGDGSEFWRYSIVPDADIVSSTGLFPPNGSIIADQTPLFQWDGMSIQYRLQVSTDDLFSNIVIDEVVFDDEYQTQSELADTLYFWRTGTPFGGGTWNWATARSFTEQGGFERLDPIPEGVARGAAMAYSGGLWQGDPSIIVLNGYVDEDETRYFHRWGMETEQWYDLSFTDPAPMDEMAGTSLTTGDPIVGQSGWYASAVFGNSSGANRPYSYAPCRGDYDMWEVYPESAFEAFPGYLGPGAEFVHGPAPFCYLTTGAKSDGEPTKGFYAIDPERGKHKKDKNRGGSQSGDVLAGGRRAQVIASTHGVKVEYQLSAAARVRATLHDAVGRQVDMLDIGVQQPGTHRLSWSQDRVGRGLAAGAYFVLLEMGVEKATIKAVIR